MSGKKTVIAFVTLLVTLAGCQKGDEGASIQLRNNYIGADADGVFFAVSADGAWTLTPEFPEGTEPWASVRPESGVGSMNNVILSYDANPSKEVRTCTLVLRPEKGTSARAGITQDGKGISWLELPAIPEDEGRVLLIHNMQGGKYRGKGTDVGGRNWSCLWDYDEHMSVWVAYPLNNSLKGAGTGRTEAWGFDALLPAEVQPDLRNGSYGGGWTRGHQIPSADRQRNHAENASTFVSTNMTPQEYNFNGGIWADLETRVRSYAAQADTLYVVTGALFDRSTQFSGNNSGFTVKIPTHYFKALLYLGPSAYAKETEGHLMAGFILPHDRNIAGANCMNYCVSIDALEEQTGIDFFPNLARRNRPLSEKLEAATPHAQFWK